MGLQPTVNPRGWKAAREAERRAAAARATKTAQAQEGHDQFVKAPKQTKQQRRSRNGNSVSEPLAALPPGVPPPAPLLQTCSLSGRPEYEALQAAARRTLVTAVVAAFTLGLLCGVLLHAWLRRRRMCRRGRAAGTAVRESQLLSAAGSCVDARNHPGQLQPAGPLDHKLLTGHASEAKPASPADTAGANSATAALSAGAVTAAEGEGESPEPKPSAQPATQDAHRAPEAAVAAAVQEILLHHTSSGSDGDGGTCDAPAVSPAAQPPLALQAELEKQRADAVVAVAAPAGSGAVGGALGMLPSEDQADVAAAAQLVLTMCASMHVDPAHLSRGERLQLIYTMLSAWQAQQARRHTEQMHRLGSEANALQSEQRDIAAAQAAQRAARDAYRLSLERTAQFRAMCSDTLTFGLAVMLAAATYQLAQRGLLASLTASCGSLAAALGGGGRGWGLWGAWRAGEALACYLFSIGDAVLGIGVLLAAPWLLYRSGLMSDYHTMPVSKLFIGLGFVCGTCGYLAVGKLGGRRGTWLACWEAWVALHIAGSAAAHRVQRISLRAAAVRQQRHATGMDGARAAAAAGAAIARQAGAGMYEHGHGWLPAVMWVGLGLALPALAGTLPFRP